jgi:hypothetical protein
VITVPKQCLPTTRRDFRHMPRRYESLSFSEKCCWLFPESLLWPAWQAGISPLAKSLKRDTIETSHWLAHVDSVQS